MSTQPTEITILGDSQKLKIRATARDEKEIKPDSIFKKTEQATVKRSLTSGFHKGMTWKGAWKPSTLKHKHIISILNARKLSPPPPEGDTGWSSGGLARSNLNARAGVEST